MASLDTPRNPRWHLMNLVPIWICQALNSLVVAFLPFFCFMMCGPYDKPTHKVAPIICLVSFATIATEAYFFFARRLGPAPSLVFQTVKFVVVGAQWMVMAIHDRVGTGRPGGSLLVMAGQALLFAVLSLPFSVHLAYAIIAYVSFLAHGGPEKAREFTREAELALLKEGDGGYDIGVEVKNEEPAQRSVADELRWPPRGKLLPNYIFQLVFPFILWLLRYMSSSSWNKSGLFSNMLTYICLAVLICSTSYGIYCSVKKDGKRLSSQYYLKLQTVKIGALYLLLDLVVLAWEGWKLQIGNWGRSLMGVFILSILFGSPFIAECVFAAAEYESCRRRMLGDNDEIKDEDDDLELNIV